MTFLSPLFLIGAVAAAIPIALHLLKREPEARVQFAAVQMLKRAPVEHTARHRLRELVLLALRVTSLVLLALAFARPFFVRGGAATVSGIRIVALDTSFSMAAPGRFERAQQLARDAVAHAAAGELVGVVTFADDAAIAATPSADHVLATSTIDQARVSFGGTRYRAALAAATQALAGRRGTIVVVTDLQEGGWDAGDRVSVPDGTTIEIADVGAMPANLAVTGVRTVGERVVAAVYNGGTAARDVRAHLSVDGKAVGDATTTIAPKQTADVAFAAVPRGTTAAVSVDDPDGVQADNVRYAMLGTARHPTILVITGSGALSREAFYLQHALEAGDAEGGSFAVSSTSGGLLSTSADAGLDAAAAVVLASTRGLERRGRELLAAYVRDGGGLFIAAGPDVDGDVAADILGGAPAVRITAPTVAAEARIAPAEARHPIFRPFTGGAATLALVRFQRTARVDGRDCQTLARLTTGDKGLIECPLGNGRVLILASDLENRWNDFPRHASFVPFVHESMRYLAGTKGRAAEYVVASAPAGVPKEPGVHEIPASKPGRPPRRVVVNVDPRETDAARITAADFQAAVAHLGRTGAEALPLSIEARQQEDDQHLWQYALALMVITLAVEGVLAARTA